MGWSSGKIKMITVRKSEERRTLENEGHKTWMTFDAENKTDPLQNGFGELKILNEEILSPGSGFTLHPHKDMVVITYLLQGVIIYKGPLSEPEFMETKDFRRADVTPDAKQYVFNVSHSEEAHIFQSGFASVEDLTGGKASKPEGLKKLFTHAERQGVLKLIASPDGRAGSLPLQQDVQMYSTFVNKGNHTIHEISPGRSAWLHVVKGHILLEDLDLQTGDGAGLTNERSLSFTAKSPAEILLFDLCGLIPEVIRKAAKSGMQAVEIR
jgi:hypothetical protein